jgi:hypothetical protein
MVAKNWLKGMVAGFLATVALSALMLLKERMGLAPQLNPIEMFAKMAGGSTPAVGWVPHFLIGTVLWGSLFPIFDANVPSGSHHAIRFERKTPAQKTSA